MNAARIFQCAMCRLALFKKSYLLSEYVKTQVVIGVALLCVAAILFISGLPSLVLSITHSCPLHSYMGNCSHVEEVSLSSFAAAFAIGGVGLLALSHLEHRELKDRRTNV